MSDDLQNSDVAPRVRCDLPVARLRESDSGIFLEHQEKALAFGDRSKEAFSEVFLQPR